MGHATVLAWFPKTLSGKTPIRPRPAKLSCFPGEPGFLKIPWDNFECILGTTETSYFISTFTMDQASAYCRDLSPLSPEIEDNNSQASPKSSDKKKKKGVKIMTNNNNSAPKMIASKNRQYGKLTELRQNKVRKILVICRKTKIFLKISRVYGEVHCLAKIWIYLTPYVCTERIFDSRPIFL